MTEFVIAATYVLIPLFVFIPLFAKYIDFKHAAIQAARYQAWEYTVWYDDAGDRDILDNFNSGHSGFRIPEKPLAVTRDESKVRLMSNIGTEIDDGVGTSTGSAIPLISDADATATYSPRLSWHDHRRRPNGATLPFFDGSLSVTVAETDDDTPTITIFGVDVGSWLNTIVDVVQMGFDAVSAIINVIASFSANNQSSGTAVGAGPVFAGNPGFSAMNTDGYSHVAFEALAKVYEGGVVLPAVLGEDAVIGERTLGFPVKAGVVADGWNAGGTAHAYLQVGGTTPSTLVNELLNLPGLSQIWDLISFIAPELSRCDPPGPPDPLIKSPLAAPEGHLWLGYVDGDVVHPDRLSVEGEDPSVRLGAHQCDDSGRCVWDDTVRALDPPLSHSPCNL
jgi:hypothetical protein